MIADVVQHAPENAMHDLGEIARFHERSSSSGRWEIWMDSLQARAVCGAARAGVHR